MKATVLILPDAKASFVSYMKRQKVLSKYHPARAAGKTVVTLAARPNCPRESNGVMETPHPRHPLNAEQNALPEGEPSSYRGE
jgi:hypothetical protein